MTIMRKTLLVTALSHFQRSTLKGILTRQPLVPVRVVGSNRGLASLKDLQSMLADNNDAKTRGDTQSLLGGGNNDIDVPLIESDLFRTNGANTINNNESLWRKGLDDLSNTLDVRQDTSAFVI
jgi:hypothetical protein